MFKPRYLDGLLNIDNSYSKRMVSQIYPTELQLNKANYFDTEAINFYFHYSVDFIFLSFGIMGFIVEL